MSLLKYFPRTVGLEAEASPSPMEAEASPSPMDQATEVEAFSSAASPSADDGNVPLTMKKRKWSEHLKFASNIRVATGLELQPASDIGNRSASQCMLCWKNSSKTICIRNVTARWLVHAKTCPGLSVAARKKMTTPALSAEAQAFVLHVMAGGNVNPNANPNPYPSP